GPAGVTDEATLGHWAGRWAAAPLFWNTLAGALVLAALFAPSVLDPRHTVLLLAQPLGRGDLALGVFAAVCAMALLAFLFLAVMLFLGLHALGVQVSARFLLVPLPLLLAVAALYARVLLATYGVRHWPFAV